MEGSLLGALAALVLFGAFQCCGMAVARFALPGESGGARLLLGSVAGTVMLQWFPVVFAFFLGFTLPAHLCALALALACGALCWRFSQRGAGPGLGQALLAFRRRKALWAALALWGFACFLVWKSLLFQDGCVYSSQATYGDTCMHLSFITSLARQGEFPPEYSILPGTRLSYPFLGDSVSASLYLVGAPLNLAYALPMWFAMGQVIFGFLLFAAQLLGSWNKGLLAWTLFFFNGGLGFVYFLGGGWENFTRIFTEFYQTPTNLAAENIRWVNVVVDMMLPQRALLFGWGVLFPLLYLLYRAVFEGQKRYFWWGGVLAGLLPMIHTHSFLALALVCGAWMVYTLCRDLGWARPAARLGKALAVLGLLAMACLKTVLHATTREDSPKLLWVAGAGLCLCAAAALVLVCLRCLQGKGRQLLSTWGTLLLITCGLALPQLLFWTFGQAGGFVRGHFAWVTGEDSYLWFYLKNLGLTGVLALLGLLAAKPGEFGKYAPALPIWFLGEFVEFQPNDYDNNKLFYVAFAFLCCAGAQALWQGLSRLKAAGPRRCLAGASLGLCCCAAVLTMGREAVARYVLFDPGAIALCGYMEEELPADALVLTDSRHNNEVASLAGRDILCGSPSYLYYHGLDYTRQQEAARQMYESPEAARNLFGAWGVDYVLVSDFERGSYQVDEAGLAALFPKVYDDGSRALYQVRTEKERV